MLLHYTISEDDYIAFNIYHARQMPNYRRTIIGLCLLVPVLMAAVTPLVFLVFPNTSPWGWAAVATATSGLGALFMPARFKALIRRHIKKITKERNEFIGQFSLELREDGLVYTGNAEKLEIAYQRIVKITDDAGLTYLFMGALSAIIVPPAAFADAGQKGAFLNLLRVRCPEAVFALPASAQNQRS